MTPAERHLRDAAAAAYRAADVGGRYAADIDALARAAWALAEAITYAGGAAHIAAELAAMLEAQEVTP